METLLQFILELLLQGGAEMLVELLSYIAEGEKKQTRHPAVVAVLYFILGGAMGLLSIAVFPHSFIHHDSMRLANLVVTPLALGGFMALVGRGRRRRGQELVPLDQFVYAALFAFAMALVRFYLAA